MNDEMTGTMGTAVGTEKRSRREFQSDKEFLGFNDRIRQGKIRICGICGGIMQKRSRLILSFGWALALMASGLVFMTIYGVLVNFTNVPWFLKFILPSLYYIGALFVGSGILFFFIRERVWLCESCRTIDKR